MGNLRFYRRRGIFPGLSVNISKSGPSLSVGVRGAHVTLGRGGIRRTVGIPGSGLFYTSYSGRHTGYHSAAAQESPLNSRQQATQDRIAELTLIAIAIIGVALAIGVIIGAAV